MIEKQQKTRNIEYEKWDREALDYTVSKSMWKMILIEKYYFNNIDSKVDEIHHKI